MTPIHLRSLEQRLSPRFAAVRSWFAAPGVARAVRRGGWAVVGAALIWYVGLMVGRMGVYAGGSDSSGYLNNTKLLLAGRLRAEQRKLPELAGTPLPAFTYVPVCFVPAKEQELAPIYAFGLSALFALAAAGSSLEAGPTAVMAGMLLGSLLATYWLARQSGLGCRGAVLCSVFLAASPLFQFMSLQAMSDMPALLWTTVALALGWASRRQPWLAALAGLVVALTVFIRPANALVVLPLACALGTHWRRWTWLACGGLPGAVIWLLANKVLFGQYLATGYGEVSGLFSWSNVLPSLWNYGVTMPWVLPPVVFAVFCAPWSRRHADQRGAVMMAVVWVLAVTLFYAAYRYTHETWWYLRFILPAFPALIVLSVLGLRRLQELAQGTSARRWNWWRQAAAVVVVLLAIGCCLRVQVAATREEAVLDVGEGERVYPEACAWVREHVPAEALVYSMQVSGALYYSNPGIVLRWDPMTPALSQEVFAAASRARRPVFAAFFPFEVEQAFGRHLAGRWSQVGAVRQVTIWRLDDANGTMP